MTNCLIDCVDGGEEVQGGAGGRHDCEQAPGHTVQQHARTESLQVRRLLPYLSTISPHKPDCCGQPGLALLLLSVMECATQFQHNTTVPMYYLISHISKTKEVIVLLKIRMHLFKKSFD